jgi:hypothetical protein
MRTVDLIVHCWRYSRALNYLLSSLVLYPPKRVQVDAMVCFSADDAPTCGVLDYFGRAKLPETVKNSRRPLGLPELLNRTIARNIGAKKTTADLVWFLDGD